MTGIDKTKQINVPPSLTLQGWAAQPRISAGKFVCGWLFSSVGFIIAVLVNLLFPQLADVVFDNYDTYRFNSKPRFALAEGAG